MNKTQRRKALQQWEAENQHIVEALRREGKEPKPEAVSPRDGRATAAWPPHDRRVTAA